MSGLMSRHWKPFSVKTASLAVALLLVSAPAGAQLVSMRHGVLEADGSVLLRTSDW